MKYLFLLSIFLLLGCQSRKHHFAHSEQLLERQDKEYTVWRTEVITDTVFLMGNMQVGSAEQASRFIVPAGSQGEIHERMFDISGVLISETSFVINERGQKERMGTEKLYYSSSQLKAELPYAGGEFHGLLRSWWENGQLRREDHFSEGKLVKGSCFDEQGNPAEHYPYLVDAAFPGGDAASNNFLRTTLRYPTEARNSGIMGTVFAGFTVDKEGNITQLHIAKGVSPSLDAMTLETLSKMPKWIPALQDGELVEQYQRMPVRYVLN